MLRFLVCSLQLFWQNAKIHLWPFSHAQHYYMVYGLTFKINDLAVKSFASFKHSEVGNKTAHPIWLHLEKTSVLSKLLTHELSLLWYWFRVPCLKQYDFTIVQFNGIRHELDQVLQRVYYHQLKLPFVHVLGQFYYLHQTKPLWVFSAVFGRLLINFQIIIIIVHWIYCLMVILKTIGNILNFIVCLILLLYFIKPRKPYNYYWNIWNKYKLLTIFIRVK